MELKVWVEGIQRIVCGVTEKTTCQDVVYALAHATGKTGRFTLIERWRNNERLLAPQEHPLKVLQKWGEYSHDVQFILQRSALDGTKNAAPPTAANNAHPSGAPSMGKKPSPPAAVWKPPPGTKVNGAYEGVSSRLSPDSGRGSDRTGSDTSNSYSDKEQHLQQHKSASSLPQQQQHPTHPYGHTSTTSLPGRPTQQQQQPYYPPAYRPPPSPMTNGQHPPPYRNPPPAPSGSHGHYPHHQQQHYPGYASRQPTMGLNATGPNTVRPPHYSPPPTHRNTHLSRHPSKSSLMGSSSAGVGGASSRMNQHGLPSRQHAQMPSSRVNGNNNMRYMQQQQVGYQQGGPPPSDLADLVSLVSAQQSTLYSQQAEIKHCDAEAQFLEHQYYNGAVPSASSSSNTNTSSNPTAKQSSSSPSTNSTTSSSLLPASNTKIAASQPQQDPSQIELVLSEVRRLEDVSSRNDQELQVLSNSAAEHSGSMLTQPLMSSTSANGSNGGEVIIQSEISQLKARLAGTDQELQKTNSTLRRLGDEMRSMSIEKSRQREQELVSEMDRLQAEIKSLQKSSEEGANISQQLSQEVKEVEDQISARKAEVEQLIKEMREANMESLAISPPEESKQFLDGPMKPGTARKMMGSPRALENAVPTAKNPHGVWV